MGTVYTALDTKLQREVALKMMKREMAADPQVMDGFYREARAAAALNHTNIIHIYSFDEFSGQPYLVMELANSGSVDQRIETETRLPERDVLDVGTKMCSALGAALKHNLLHRDIKPGNILYNTEGEPKLITDFGHSPGVRAAEAEDTYEQHIWGTVYYVAPEKVERKGEDFRSDMYSLGGTLYHALTGHAPFEGPDASAEGHVAAHVHTQPAPAHHIVPDITEMTSNAIMQALAKRPDDRYASYEEMQMALEAARSHLMVQQHLQQAAEPHPGARRAGVGGSGDCLLPACHRLSSTRLKKVTVLRSSQSRLRSAVGLFPQLATAGKPTATIPFRATLSPQAAGVKPTQLRMTSLTSANSARAASVMTWTNYPT